MKRVIFTALAILCFLPFHTALFAQQITVAPAHLVCDYNVPEKLDNQVKSKIQRALSAYGISSEIGMSHFAMVPEVTINDERSTTTIPVYCEIDFDLTISLKDVYTGKTFATFTRNALGKGTNKANAISKGVSAVPLNTPEFRMFCEQAKDKVLNYYSAQMPAIIAAANAAASSRDFDQALGILCEIPEECPGFDSKVAPLMSKFYTTEINLEGEAVLNEANAAWSESPDENGAERVAQILAKMPPACSSSAGASALLDQVKKRVQTINDREFAFEKRQADRQYALQKQSMANAHSERVASINAARAIGVAWAKNQPRTITKVYIW